MLLNWLKNFPVRIAKAKLFNSYRDARDNWIYQEVNFSLNSLGYKSNENMAWYMEGDSEVNISNIDELSDWLIHCEYESLSETRRKDEIWQTPLIFEKERKGNCVCSSLWTWRKLIELGFKVEFFVGEWLPDGDPKQHAWVVFEKNGREILIDTVSKEKGRMFYDLDSVRQLYIPWASVDSSYKCRLYGGYCSAIKKKNNWDF